MEHYTPNDYYRMWSAVREAVRTTKEAQPIYQELITLSGGYIGLKLFVFFKPGMEYVDTVNRDNTNDLRAWGEENFDVITKLADLIRQLCDLIMEKDLLPAHEFVNFLGKNIKAYPMEICSYFACFEAESVLKTIFTYKP